MVIAWLGDDPEGHLFAFKELMSDVHPSQDGQPDFECFKRNHLPSPDSPKQKALNAFMALPYFSRVWVMQEVILASSIKFV